MLARTVPAAFGLRRPAEVAIAVHTGAVRYDGLHVLAPVLFAAAAEGDARSEEHTSEPSHGYISYAVFCLIGRAHV